MNNRSRLEYFKERAKDTKWVKGLYTRFPRILFRLDPIIPLSSSIKLVYRLAMGKRLRLDNPRDFNEKIQWLKVYYRDPLYVQCADKYRVREFVEDQGVGEILNEIYRVYDSADDIDFDELPNRFVMKTNNACGTLVICHDKTKLDERETKKKFRKWLKLKYGYSSGELHYNYIKPLVIVEKNLATHDGTLPVDYKIFCFNGKPEYVSVRADRDAHSNTVVQAYFDFNWNPMDFVPSPYAAEPKRFVRPANLEKMYDVASKLSKPFPFVRVDLYEIDNKIIFGELTLTPTSGFSKALTQDALDHFGALLTLPQRSTIRRWV